MSAIDVQAFHAVSSTYLSEILIPTKIQIGDYLTVETSANEQPDTEEIPSREGTKEKGIQILKTSDLV